MTGAWRRLWPWLDDRLGITKNILPVIRHPIPPGTGWAYVFGSATLVAFLLQVVTGIALSTTYVSSAGDAYQSLQAITTSSSGSVLRGLHYFGASAMIVLVGLHAVRVFITGSYKFPRELNWISGVMLLGLTLTMGFTGQVLRWDQDGVWSVVVAAEQAGRVPVIGTWLATILLGGQRIGAGTLSHMYAYHVFLVPISIAAIVGVHVYLALHNGISEPPTAGQPVEPRSYRERYQALLDRSGVPFWPDAAWRDAVGILVLVTVVLLLAVLVGPKPLGSPPNPALVVADPRPDWYLLWYFAVLALLPPQIEQYLMWLIPLAAGLVLLLLPLVFPAGERHPARRPWAWSTVLVVVIGIGVLWRVGRRAPWSPDFAAGPLPDSVVTATLDGVSPADSAAARRGAVLFHDRGCLYCHTISGFGGIRGPNLTYVGDRLPPSEIVQWMANGGTNMPAFGQILDTDEMLALKAFLSTRRAGPR